MIQKLLHLGLGLGLFALVGCGGEDDVTMEEMPTPSQAAAVTNENPSSPDVDIPATPADEGAPADNFGEDNGSGVPAGGDVTSEDAATGTEEPEEAPEAEEPAPSGDEPAEEPQG